MTILESDSFSGVYPIDFILQTVIEEGLELFRSNPENMPNLVFGHFVATYLQKYGQAKIDEIAKYIRETQIPVVQHFALIPQQLPCFSILLLNGREDEQYAGFDDHAEQVDVLNSEGTAIEDREYFKYSPMMDEIQIGIHNSNTPDLTKYLYYFLVHIFITSKTALIRRGLELTTWNATDISRVNEYLPENVFSRFVNLTALSTPRFSLDEDVTIVTDFDISPDDITGVEVE